MSNNEATIAVSRSRLLRKFAIHVAQRETRIKERGEAVDRSSPQLQSWRILELESDDRPASNVP